jgi:hypothetical protein
MLVFYLYYDFLLRKLARVILQPHVFSFNICLKVVELINNVLMANATLKSGEILNHPMQQCSNLLYINIRQYEGKKDEDIHFQVNQTIQ